MKKLKIAVVGLAHVHAPGMMEAFAQDARAELTACADLPAAMQPLSAGRGTRLSNVALARDHYGMAVYEDAERLLCDVKPDIILSCAENTRHLAVAELAARHGCHLVFEKPMATRYADARRMAALMEQVGRKLVINWPTAWGGVFQKARGVIAGGAIGTVLRLRWTNGSSFGPFSYGEGLTPEEMAAEWWYQPAQGGGAYLDYCGYGCMVSTMLIGSRAVGAFGLRANLNSPFARADDNGIVIARFPGAVATIEGTWTAMNKVADAPMVVHGSEGSLGVYNDRIEVFRTRFGYEPDEVHEVTPLPEGRRNFAEDLLHCLETGEPLNQMVDVKLNLDMMALLDAGIRSASSGSFELVGDEHFTVEEIG